MERLTVILGALPGLVGVAIRVLQVMRERSAHEQAARALSLLKLKCEIEALRKKHELEFPPLGVSQEEVKKIQMLELPWSDPRRIRSTFWLGYVRGARKISVVAILAGMGLLALMSIVGAVVMLIGLTSPGLPESEGLNLLFILVMDSVVIYLCSTNSIEIYRALRLLREAPSHSKEATTGA